MKSQLIIGSIIAPIGSLASGAFFNREKIRYHLYKNTANQLQA